MPQKRETTAWAIVGVTVLIAALAGATTYAHRATFNVVENAGTIVEWIVVAFVAIGIVGTLLRRHRLPETWAVGQTPFSDDGASIIDAVAVDVTERPPDPEDRRSRAERPDATRAE